MEKSSKFFLENLLVSAVLDIDVSTALCNYSCPDIFPSTYSKSRVIVFQGRENLDSETVAVGIMMGM